MNPIKLGTFLLILGLICWQFGLLVILHRPFVNFISSIMPLQSEFLGFILQFLGSALIVSGIINLVSSITAEASREQTYRLFEALQRIEGEVRELYAHQKTQGTSICKFCGAPIENGGIFCQACGGSQK